MIERGMGLECINELYVHKDVDDRYRDGLWHVSVNVVFLFKKEYGFTS